MTKLMRGTLVLPLAKAFTRSLHVVLVGSLAVSTMAVSMPSTARAAAPDPQTLNAQARAKYEQKDFEGAATLFLEAFKSTGEPNLLFNASVAFDEAGNLERALELLRKYRALAPAAEQAGIDADVRKLEARVEAAHSVDADGSDTRARDSDPPSGQDKPVKLIGPGVIALIVTTAVGAGLGVGFGVAALRNKKDAEQGCFAADGRNVCPTGSRDLNDKRAIYAVVADVGIVLGAVSAVSLAVLLGVKASRNKRARAKNRASVSAQPFVGFGHAGMGLRGRF